MSKRLKAVYENGVFRPLEAVDLEEHQTVTVIAHDDRAVETQEDEISCYDIAKKIGLGTAEGLPADLSTYREHFEGFGQ